MYAHVTTLMIRIVANSVYTYISHKTRNTIDVAVYTMISVLVVRYVHIFFFFFFSTDSKD